MVSPAVSITRLEKDWRYGNVAAAWDGAVERNGSLMFDALKRIYNARPRRLVMLFFINHIICA